jgi:hypothetical protein
MRHTLRCVEAQTGNTEVNAPIAREVRLRVRMLAVRTAEHLERTHQLDAAADILEKYLSKHGAEAEIMRLLGGMRLKQGRAREAALLLERALARHFECDAARRAASRADECAETAEEPPVDNDTFVDEADPRQLRMDLPINLTA